MNINSIMNKVKQNKKMVGDFAYSIIATTLVTVVLQLVIYPYLSTAFSTEIYGQMLTLMGIANIFLVSFGGALNNLRLIQKNLYDEHELEGDYNIILLISLSLSTLVFAAIVGAQIQGLSLFFLIGYVVLGIIQNYWMVSFRIVINYKKNLLYNALVSIGYIVGICVVGRTQAWSLVFLLGQIMGILYLLKSTSLYKEKYRTTKFLSKTVKAYMVLVATNLVANMVIYLDRIFLYPIVGGDQVAIYTVSSFVGKSIGLVITPIAGVLLSYYSQKTFRMTAKRYWMINATVLIGGGIVGGIAVLFAPFITNILYPTIADSAQQYIVIANIGSLIGVLANIVSPSIMKFANIYWQILIQLVYSVLYIALGYFWMSSMGLMGFCFATLVTNLVRLMMLIAIGHFSILKRTKGES